MSPVEEKDADDADMETRKPASVLWQKAAREKATKKRRLQRFYRDFVMQELFKS